jgi:hypothetical protein
MLTNVAFLSVGSAIAIAGTLADENSAWARLKATRLATDGVTLFRTDGLAHRNNSDNVRISHGTPARLVSAN